jgi:hypothetical protein
MRCEEIQERFIEFVYDEGGVSPVNTEIQEHLRSCSACREEFEELKQTRRYLQLWKDESPLRSVNLPVRNTEPAWKFGWKYARYAAIAAMLVVCFLAIANAQISWNSKGFSFSTRLFAGRHSEQNYYTKEEMKRALDDTELRINETNYTMMLKMLDTIEQDRLMEMHLSRGHAAQYQNKN